jgi:uncharacterized damage-inducible protein DinB
MGDEGGMDALRALGARSVPVVSRGDKYVFAQVIKDVVDFLGLEEETRPELTPAQLAQRYQDIVGRAVSLTRQMPDECLERELPNRPRSWKVVMHHVFQIPNAFLEMEESGQPMRYETMIAPPPDEMQTSDDIARFGEGVATRFAKWWQQNQDSDFDRRIEVYFGQTSRHEMLERTVWHSTQHVRQIASLLEQAGVTPAQPLIPAHIQGLPLTEKIWDEA